MRGPPSTPDAGAAGAMDDGHWLDAMGRACADAWRGGLLAFTHDGRLLGCNAHVVESWELPAAVLEGGTVDGIVDWLSTRGDEASLAMSQLISSDDGPAAGELALSDGRTIAWRRMVAPGHSGRFWSFEDVSEERQTASALVSAANWLEILELHTGGVLLELDERGLIVSLWGARESVFDQPDGSLQGKKLAEVFDAAQGAALDACVSRVLSSGTSEEHEYTSEVRGKRRVFASRAILLPTGDAGPKRVTLMISDVSERVRMQAQLIQSERLASVGLLAAGVAHEVNNPLGYILLNLELVQKALGALRGGAAVDVAGLATSVEVCLEGARRVRSIVRDLTCFCRSEETSRMPVDIHRPLEFALTMAEHETRQRARVVRDYGGAPNVCANESRLSQLFLNLIVNAAQAIQKGGPDDNEIRVVTRQDPQGRAIVEVHDSGNGIAPAQMAQIFDPFYTTKAPGVGTGLGLTICQSIATALNGRIDVEKRTEGGSVFRVLLPAHDPGT